MYRYQFKRESKYIEYGVVTANTEDEALEKIENEDYDDIFDNSFVETIPETIEIESFEEVEDEDYVD